MIITIKLFANFREGRFKKVDHEYPDGVTVEETITSLGIDMDEVGVIMVNSRHANPGLCLEDKDILAVFPVIGGG